MTMPLKINSNLLRMGGNTLIIIFFCQKLTVCESLKIFSHPQHNDRHVLMRFFQFFGLNSFQFQFNFIGCIKAMFSIILQLLGKYVFVERLPKSRFNVKQVIYFPFVLHISWFHCLMQKSSYQTETHQQCLCYTTFII